MSKLLTNTNVEQCVKTSEVDVIKNCVSELKHTVAKYPIDLYVMDNGLYELRIRDLDDTLIADELSADELQIATYILMETINSFTAKEQLINADKPFIDMLSKEEPKDGPFPKDAFGYELRKGMPVLFPKCHYDDRFIKFDTGKYMCGCPSGKFCIIEPDNHDDYYKMVREDGCWKKYPRLIWRSTKRIVAAMPFGKMPKPGERKEAIEEGHAIDDKLNPKEVVEPENPQTNE